MGLSLVALTAPGESFLRQGCNLVPDVDHPRDFKVVHADGKRETVTLDHKTLLSYAAAAAEKFGVGNNDEQPFEVKRADKSAEGKQEKAKEKKTKSK